MDDATSNNEQFQKLTPIHCSECGSAIPLVDVERTECIYCGTPVSIPPEYRRGQDAHRRLSEIRRHATEFIARLGSRPRRWEVWVSLIPSWAFFLILILFTLTGFGGSALSLEIFISNLIGTNVTDYMPAILIIPIYLGMLFLFLGLAMTAFFLIRRRVFVTRRLMTVLAAGAPVKPGGPATCRRCGAPFIVEANELVAACDYCSTENFLQVPPEWLSATRKLTTSSGRNVFWAEREFEREMTSSQKSLKNQLSIFGTIMLFLAGGFISADSAKIKVWRDDVSKAVRPVYGLSHEVAVPEIGKPFRLHGILRKYRNMREFRYSIALKKKERIIVSILENSPVEVRLRGRYSLQSLVASKEIPAEFVVEPGGWFDFSLSVPSDKPLPLIRIDIK